MAILNAVNRTLCFQRQASAIKEIKWVSYYIFIPGMTVVYYNSRGYIRSNRKERERKRKARYKIKEKDR